jgi:hypothetical protein
MTLPITETAHSFHFHRLLEMTDADHSIDALHSFHSPEED